MVVSVAAGRPRTARWVLAAAPVLTAVVLMVAFGLAAGSAAGSRPATNPAVGVPGLLTAADAGHGWTATYAGAIVSEGPGCFRPRAAMAASGPGSLVAVVLSAPGGLPQVNEMAARYPTAGAATAAFASVAHAMSCSNFATASGEGSVAPITFAGLGDRA